MKSGIYAVTFAAGPMAGAGVAVVEDGKIQGGDHGFIYRGRYELNESKVTANVEVTQHQTGVQSVMGVSGSFKLALTGSVSDSSFDLSGAIPERPQVRITLRGQRKTDLVS
ncbi:MAG: GrlR family regulatory protein [Phycisphaerales bacterium]